MEISSQGRRRPWGIRPRLQRSGDGFVLAAADHAEEFIAELPTLVRRLKTLILIVCLSIPVFLVATIWVLWHALT